ncbi:hypothetical protein RD792_005846 [Penstemon davidsonii]|uniref:Seryl-tRNA synthetase n=1 Tax=Penstemon davidsonii TaxID=160366 RepID=A0ABR0DWY5_9LAMI|nr:hypothetical protein RD792_005846 [Penstemon davidsonii]
MLDINLFREEKGGIKPRKSQYELDSLRSDKNGISKEIGRLKIFGSDWVKHQQNSTLTATERTLCAILENYQKEDGVEIPEVLRNFMGGKSFIPFKNTTVKEAKGKKKKSKE